MGDKRKIDIKGHISRLEDRIEQLGTDYEHDPNFKNEIKLAIVGSRGFNNYTLLCKEVDDVTKYFDIIQIISGGAAGADSLGARYAKEHNIDTEILIPDWKTHGKKGGFIRNGEIVEKCDYLIAFWDGKSNGTRDSINKAKAKDKLLRIIYND